MSSDDAEAIGYEPVNLVPHRRIPVAAVLAVVQFVWFFPAVFVTWILLCNTRLIQTPSAEFASAAAVTAPSFGALAFGIVSCVRRDEARRSRAWSAAAVIVSIGWIAYAFAATIHELRHPSPFPCL
jgi:hypothetical protein